MVEWPTSSRRPRHAGDHLGPGDAASSLGSHHRRSPIPAPLPRGTSQQGTPWTARDRTMNRHGPPHGPPGTARDRQGPPGTARDRQGPPRTARDRQGPHHEPPGTAPWTAMDRPMDRHGPPGTAMARTMAPNGGSRGLERHLAAPPRAPPLAEATSPLPQTPNHSCGPLNPKTVKSQSQLKHRGRSLFPVLALMATATPAEGGRRPGLQVGRRGLRRVATAACTPLFTPTLLAHHAVQALRSDALAEPFGRMLLAAPPTGPGAIGQDQLRQGRPASSTERATHTGALPHGTPGSVAEPTTACST
jgi:hypothetical protein